MYKNRTHIHVCMRTPVSEVGKIMRTNNRTGKQLVFSVARAMLIVFCFIVTFAFAMSAESLGLNGTLDMNSVAEAGEQKFIEQDDEAKIGTASPIQGDNGELTAQDFSYPSGGTTASGKTTWSFTETFANIPASLTNHQAIKSDGNTKLYTWVGDNGIWNYGVSNASAANSVNGVINYNPGSFIQTLLKRSDVKVYAKWQAYVDRGSSTSHVFYTAQASAAGFTAKEGMDVPDQPNNSTNPTTITSGEVQLTSDSPIFTVSIGVYWGLKLISRDVWVRFQNLQITLRIEMDNSASLDTATIVDGSAPVVASQYVSNVTDTYAPYLPTTDQTYGNYSWPVWTETLSSQLSKYTDSVSFGYGKMPSFTNKSLGSYGTGKYYKQSIVRYVDTYDYSSSGGFSYSTLQRLYTDAIASGKTEAQAAAAVKALLPYMSIGMRKISNIDFSNFDPSNPAASITFTTNSSDRFVSGIKTVQVGDAWKDMENSTGQGAVFTVSSISTAGTKNSPIYVDGEVVGYAKVQKVNRAEVVVTTYMYKNAKVRTTITDNGDAATTTEIDFGGIDTQSPTVGTKESGATNSGVTMDLSDYILLETDRDKLKWHRTKTLSNGTSVEIFEDEDSAGYSPYVWFYTVNRADSWDELAALKTYANYSTMKAAGLVPIAYGEMNSFEYDFTTGKAKSYGSAEFDAANDLDITDDVTGAGYYRFNFFMVDMAGNVGGVVNYFVKVDYDAPQYSVELSYVDDSTGEYVDILASDNGSKWATGETTLSFVFDKLNFSGNTLMFTDANSNYMLVIDGKGEYSGTGYGNLVRYGTSVNMTEATSNMIDLSIQSYLQKTNAKISVSKDGNDRLIVTFLFATKADTIAFISEYTAYAGQYLTTIDPDSDDMALSYINADWKDGVAVLIDRVAPMQPELNDVADVQYLMPLEGNYTIPTQKVWYTEGYNFDVLLTFGDNLVNSDYASGIVVYAGMKYITTQQQFDALSALSIESVYANITADNFKTYFDRLQTIRGDELDGDETSTSLDLVQELKGGMRVYYVWVVDQAGNASAINTYYILADGSVYTVKSSVLSNYVLGNTASINQTNADEQNVTTFSRGESVYLTLSVSEGYVPFTLTASGNQTVALLDNYMPTLTWTLANYDYAQYISFDANDYTKASYLLDDPFDLGPLSAITTLQFAQRQVITYNVTNSQVAYTSEKAVVPTIFNNDAAKGSFKYVFVNEEGLPLYEKEDGTATEVAEEAKLDENGSPVPFVPIAVGDYFVKIFIEKDDPNYVTSDFSMDENGVQTVSPISFRIIRGNAVVKAVATRSTYGDAIVLRYELEGIIEDNLQSEGIVFGLELRIADYDPSKAYDVGSYQIIANGLQSSYSNYNVNFVSAYHTIVRKDVNIQTWQAQKAYGDADPAFLFGVGANQFGEDADVAAILASVFGNYGYEQQREDVFENQIFYLYNAGNRIAREQGENAGEYGYSADSALFDVNNNYRIVIQNTQHFVITQRIVTVEVGGQSAVLPFGETVDASTIRPTYTISTADAALSQEIAALMQGKLSVSSNGIEQSDPQYSAVWVYDILLSTQGNVNIKLQLGDDIGYTVYIALQNSIIVRVKDGATFEFGYGLVWSDVNTVRFDASKFEIVGDAPTYSDLTWVASISTGDGSMPDAGSYLVRVSDAHLIGEDGQPTSDAVFVETFSITVHPAVITVVPTIAQNYKTYGDADSVYGIGFAIDKVADEAFGADGTFANLTYEQLISYITGAFSRARYTADGTLRALGSRYDDATDANGAILNILLGEGEYYGFAIGSRFVSSNANFAVKAEFDPTQRFIIDQKQITLYTKNFAGVSKSFDGGVDVNYGNDKAYDLTYALVRADDDVQLVFDAVYASAGAADVATRTSIVFSNLSLGGNSAYNYALAIVVNDGIDALVNGSQTEQAELNADTVIEIFNIDNSISIEDNRITIYIGTIGVRKTDISISKQYDNTQTLTIDGVNIANVNDNNVGTTILYQIAQRKEALIIEEESDGYTGTSVSSNYIIGNLTLFFPIDGADGINIITTGEYYDADITISVGSYNGRDGIKIVLKNMGASITQRVLGAKSFESIRTISRDYNSTAVVETEYVYSATALAQGDTESSVGLVLMGEIADGNVNAGNHSVKIASSVNTMDGVHTYVSNRNYVVDTDSINNAVELFVEIQRAKLMPNVRFVGKEYDNSAEVQTEQGMGDNALTTLRYSTNLQHELANFSIEGDVEYALSANGEIDPNVTEDLLHNVMVSGLSVVETGDNNYLKNYEIYGSRYAGGVYNTVGTVVSGVIDDYEIIDAVTVTKKLLPIIENNVEIKDKVYDGTKDAVITVKLPENYVVAEHLDKLQIVATGTFARRQIGSNIAVNIQSVELVALAEEWQALLQNYELEAFKGRFTSNIIPKPVIFDANLGEKVYNGTPNVQKSSISYSYAGILLSEQSNYAIQTAGGAYYIDGDVEVERDDQGNVIYTNANGEPLTLENGVYVDASGNTVSEKYANVLPKLGTVYNPKLANIKENYINYVLVQPSSDGSGDYIAYRDVNGDMHYYEKAQDETQAQEYFYTLPTTTKYIPYSDAENVSIAAQADAVVGCYMLNGVKVCVVKDDYAGGGVQEMERLTYINAYGKITQRSVYIKSDGIKKTDNATAFTKEYDATKKFFGKMGDGIDSDADYYYVKGSIANVISTDDVEIENIFAEFDSASTNAMYVVFSASGITGADAYKYTINQSTTTKVNAKITKRNIDAHLADGEMVYGTNASRADGTITYSLGGFDIEWVDAENSFFMNFQEYLVALGFIADVNDSVAEEDLPYIAGAVDRTYDFNAQTGVYEKAADGVAGEFVRFTGTFSLPRPTATFNSSRPTVGMVANTYRLTSGDATNFNFVADYTGRGTSELVVVKKNLFVSTDGIDKTKTYGGADPVINLNYFDEFGESGIVSGETWMSLFKVGGVDYRPVARLAIYNVSTGECTPVDKYAKISADLKENEIYVYYLEAPTGVDYNDIVANYNIVLGTVSHTADGEQTVPVITYEGYSLSKRTSMLTITLPVLSSISVRSTENTYVYSRDENNSGINRIYDVVLGAKEDDEVRYVTIDESGAETAREAVNAGVHKGFIKVKRYVSIDENDPNGYYIEWTSAEEVTITIERASINPMARKVSEYYNGKVQKYDVSGNSGNFTYDYVSLSSNDIVVTVERLVNGVYQTAQLKDAGEYRITVSMKDNFEETYPNFKAESVQTTYTILRAIANITIDTTGYDVSSESLDGARVTKLSALYDESVDYAIDFSVAMQDGALSADVKLTEEKLSLIFAKEISQAGRYTFSVAMNENCGLDPANYNIVGGSGMLELKARSLSSDGSTVSVKEGGIVANSLVVRQVDESSALVGDVAYLEIIKQYMPVLSKEGGLKDEARVASVLRMNLYCDDQIVSLDGKSVRMSVAIPENIKSMDNIAVYTVTEQGGLRKLTGYEIVDGNIEFDTDYLSALVFVDISPKGLEPWITYTIVGAICFIVLVIICVSIALIVRKSKLKKLM